MGKGATITLTIRFKPLRNKNIDYTFKGLKKSLFQKFLLFGLRRRRKATKSSEKLPSVVNNFFKINQTKKNLNLNLKNRKNIDNGLVFSCWGILSTNPQKTPIAKQRDRHTHTQEQLTTKN